MQPKNGGKAISKADFLAVIFETVELDVPKLGKLTIRELSADDRTKYNKSLVYAGHLETQLEKSGESRADQAVFLDTLESRIIAMHLINAEGELMFNPEDDEEVAIIRKIPHSIHQFIFLECMYLSKLRDRPNEKVEPPPLAQSNASTTD